MRTQVDSATVHTPTENDNNKRSALSAATNTVTDPNQAVAPASRTSNQAPSVEKTSLPKQPARLAVLSGVLIGLGLVVGIGLLVWRRPR